MARAGTAYIDFEGRFDNLTRGANRALTQVSRQVDSQSRGIGQRLGSSLARGLGNSVKAVGETLSTGLAAGAAAATAIGTSAIVAGANYNTLGQRASAAMETVLGSTDAANQMMGQLMDFATQSPFPRQAFVEATQQMLAFGFSAEDVIPTLSAVQDAIAAAGGNSQQMQEVVYVLSQIQSSGKITAQDLMQLGQRGINAADLIGQSLGMSGQEVRDSITNGSLAAGDAIKALTDGMTARFGGAAQNLKGTWTGATDSIMAKLRDLGAAFMQPFIGFTGGGALVEGINKISTAFGGFIDTAEDGSVRFTGALEPLNGVAQRLADKVLALMSGVADFIAGIDLSGVKSMFDELAPAIGAVGGALGAALGGQLPVLGSFLGGIHPLVAALGALVATSPQLRSTFVSTMNEIWTAVQPLVPQLLGLFQTLVESLLPPLLAILPPVAAAFATLIAAIAPHLPALAQAFGSLATTLVEALLPVLPAFTAALAAAAPVIVQIATVLANLIASVPPSVLTAIVTALLGLSAVGKVSGAVSSMTNAVRGAGGAMSLLGSKVPTLRAGISTLTTPIRNLAAPGGALDGIRLRLGYAGEAMRNAASTAGTTLKSALSSAATAAKGMGSAVANGAKSLGQLVASGAAAAASAAKQAAAWVANRAAMVASAVASKAMAAAQWLVNAAMNANPIMLVVAAVAAIGAALYLAYQKFEPFRNAINAIGGAFKSVFLWIWNWLKSNWQNILTVITGPIGIAVRLVIAHWDTIKLAVMRAVRFVMHIVRTVWGALVTVVGTIWHAIRTATSVVWNAIRAVIGAVVGGIRAAISGAFNAIRGVVVGVWNGIRAATSAVWNGIRSGISSVLNGIRGVVQGAVNFLKDAFSGAWSTIKGFFTDGVGAIKNAIQKVYDFLTGVPGKIGEYAGKVGRAVIDAFSGLGEAIVDGIKKIWNETIGGFGFTTPDWVPGVGGKKFTIPELAAGGYIQRPTLGLIGESGPELVLPLNDPARMRQLLAAHVPGFQTLQGGGAVGGGGGATGTQPAEPVVGTDVSGLQGWAAQVTAIFANLGIQIDTWVSTTVAALTNWANALVPTGTVPALSAWAARVQSILTTLRTQITTGLTGLSAQVQAMVNALLTRLQALVTAFSTRLTSAMTVLSTRLIGLLTTFSTRSSLIVTSLSTRVTNTFQTMASRVSSILTAASGQWHAISATAAQRVASNITSRLGAAGTRVAQIVGGYARSLANGLNPILEAIGARKIAFRNGAIVTYARGGLNANGERHVAQIAPAGAWRVWAEPETGGEAYIPLARRKRPRSRAIAAETVRRLGGDVSWYQGGAITGPTQGLNPTFLSRMRQWVASVGQPFHITSGYRDVGRQAQLYQAYLAGRGNLAAKPGSSMHNFGLAIDGNRWGSKNPGAFGLVYRVRGEPWHVEPIDAKALKGGAAGDAFGFAPLPTPPATPAGTLGDVAKQAMRFAYDRAVAWSSEALARVAADAGSGVSGGGADVSRWRGTVLQALGIIGQPMSWAGDILQQMARESGGNPSVVNRWDSNWRRGTPSVGLMQVIGPTYATHKHPAYDVGPYLYGVSTNPLANILAGLRYSLARYGDLGHFRRRGFAGYGKGGIVYTHARDFDRGGVLRPGMNLVENNTGGDERLVPSPDGARTAVAIENAHFHEGVDYDMFLRKTAFMLRAGRI